MAANHGDTARKVVTWEDQDGFPGMGQLDWTLKGDWNILRLSLQQQTLHILRGCDSGFPQHLG